MIYLINLLSSDVALQNKIINRQIVKIVWFDELHPYPVRSFTYRNQQVRAEEVSRVTVYKRVHVTLSPGVKRQKHEADFLTHTNYEGKEFMDLRRHTSIYFHMSW
jgi:hypothetical protein